MNHIAKTVEQINRDIDSLTNVEPHTSFDDGKSFFRAANSIQSNIKQLARYRAKTLPDIHKKLMVLLDVTFIGCENEEWDLLQHFLSSLVSVQDEFIADSIDDVMGILRRGLYDDEQEALTLMDSIHTDFIFYCRYRKNERF